MDSLLQIRHSLSPTTYLISREPEFGHFTNQLKFISTRMGYDKIGIWTSWVRRDQLSHVRDQLHLGVYTDYHAHSAFPL